MPCLCSYDPDDLSKKQIKLYAELLVNIVKHLEDEGHAIDCTIRDVHQLIDHLYDPSSCDENE